MGGGTKVKLPIQNIQNKNNLAASKDLFQPGRHYIFILLFTKMKKDNLEIEEEKQQIREEVIT